MRRFIAFLALWMSASTPLWADCLLGNYKNIVSVFDESGIYLAAKINDQPVLFRIDTGSIHSSLYRRSAESLGLTLSEWGGNSFPFVSNAGNEVIPPTRSGKFRAAVNTLQIGESKWHGQKMYLPINEVVDDVKPGGVPVAGILGEDFLSFFDVEIDVKARLFALYRTEGCEKADLAYWSKDYNVTDMIGYDSRSPRIQLAGRLNNSPILMQISTGMPYSAVSIAAASVRGVTSDSPDARALGPMNGVEGKSIDGWLGSFKSFTLDEETVGQAKIAFIHFPRAISPEDQNMEAAHGSRIPKGDESINYAQMMLGSDFLRAHHVLISHTQRKVYFSYNGDTPFASPVRKELQAGPAHL